MLRKLEITEISELYSRHIKRDFPSSERAPCFVIKNNMKNNVQEGFIYSKDKEELGYAINSISEESVLISLFAVFCQNRGQGVGTEFLAEVIDKYNDKKVIIVEVEKPELAKEDTQKIVCEKRISFYKKLGFKMYKDIDYKIFGVPMYLMAYSKEALGREEVIAEVKKVQYKSIRKELQNMVKIK